MFFRLRDVMIASYESVPPMAVVVVVVADDDDDVAADVSNIGRRRTFSSSSPVSTTVVVVVDDDAVDCNLVDGRLSSLTTSPNRNDEAVDDDSIFSLLSTFPSELLWLGLLLVVVVVVLLVLSMVLLLSSSLSDVACNVTTIEDGGDCSDEHDGDDEYDRCFGLASDEVVEEMDDEEAAEEEVRRGQHLDAVGKVDDDDIDDDAGMTNPSTRFGIHDRLAT